jgi:hypothetical protein
MKNAGTPAIADDSESGSGGVSADGFGARAPRWGFLVAPPFARERGPPVEAPALLGPPAPPRRCPAEVPPWALCPLTCGVEASGGAVVVVGAGADSPAGTVPVVGGAGGAGDGALGVDATGGSDGAGVVSVVLGVVASSAASELAGASSAGATVSAVVSASAASGRSACFEGRGLIGQLPSR